jgi:hypothetical protein
MDSYAQNLNNLHLHWVGSRNSVRRACRSRLVGMRMLPRSVYPLYQGLSVEISVEWPVQKENDII